MYQWPANGTTNSRSNSTSNGKIRFIALVPDGGRASDGVWKDPDVAEDLSVKPFDPVELKLCVEWGNGDADKQICESCMVIKKIIWDIYVGSVSKTSSSQSHFWDKTFDFLYFWKKISNTNSEVCISEYKFEIIFTMANLLLQVQLQIWSTITNYKYNYKLQVQLQISSTITSTITNYKYNYKLQVQLQIQN